MNNYGQNMKILQQEKKDLYEKIIEQSNRELQDGELYNDLYIGEALNGENYLAVVREEKIMPLASIYSPSHQAERYMKQFKKSWDKVILLLFGMGNIEVVRKIMGDESQVDICILYEPSYDIFKKVLEEYDITELLKNPRLIFIIEGINEDELEQTLYDAIDYRNWKSFYNTSFACYEKMFDEERKKINKICSRVISGKKTVMRTLVHFSKAGMENEIRTFFWMIDSRAMTNLIGKFPEEVPCIVVAAGPSLEKNIEVLKQAKGKSFIICVDTALKYLIERNIIPDMAVTIDPQKGSSYFGKEEVSLIPLAVSSSSDYHALEAVKDAKTIYFDATNDYIQKLYYDRGVELEYFDGGGSVGTASFHIGVRLGFKTIILIGQDLAFTDHKAHAGMGMANDGDLFYDMLLVDGYNGGKVMTRADFKQYIEWYNMRIPQLKEIQVINATEGGAKLEGAIQMTLQEAVNRFCRKKCDVNSIINKVPEVWGTREEKESLYIQLKEKYKYFQKLKSKLKTGIGDANRAINVLEREHGDMKEVKRLDKQINKLVNEILQLEGEDILIKRMIDIEANLNDDLMEEEDNTKKESIRLYQKMKTYLEHFLEALEEMLPIWEDTLEKINGKYQFE